MIARWGGERTIRPIVEIVEELNMMEEEAAEIDTEGKSIFEKLGV